MITHTKIVVSAPFFNQRVYRRKEIAWSVKSDRKNTCSYFSVARYFLEVICGFVGELTEDTGGYEK